MLLHKLTRNAGLDPSIFADLDISLRAPVSSDATDSSGLLDISILRERHVPPGFLLLLRYILPGLSSASFPQPDGSFVVSGAGFGDSLGHQSIHFRLRDKPGASALVWSCAPKTSIAELRNKIVSRLFTGNQSRLANLCALRNQ